MISQVIINGVILNSMCLLDAERKRFLSVIMFKNKFVYSRKFNFTMKIVSNHPNTYCAHAILHSMWDEEVCNLYSDHEDNMASINFIEFTLM